MIRGTALTLSLMMLFLLLTSGLFADSVTENLQSIIIEKFDDPTDTTPGEAGNRQNYRWMVTGSKFVTEGFPLFNWVETWPEALYRTPPNGTTVRSLGIQAAFDRLGYNFLEIFPVEDQDGDNGPIPTGIPIPGRIKNMDMWIWGSNYNYYVDIHLRDFRGMIHVLRLGEINFRGWQNLRVNIPTYIPQEVSYVPSRQGLELVKMVLWTRPEEKVDGFFVYFDQIKIFTDTFETPFDGEALTDPDQIDQLWGAGVGGNN
jgi:hypothetical protein